MQPASPLQPLSHPLNPGRPRRASILVGDGLQPFVDFLFGQGPEHWIRAVLAVRPGASHDAHLELALLEVDRQHRAERRDGKLDHLVPAALCVLLILQLLLQEVERLLRLGPRRRGLVSDVVACGVALVQLGSEFRVEGDERGGDAQRPHVRLWSSQRRLAPGCSSLAYALGVDLANVGYPLGQHVAGHLVAKLVAELGRLAARAAHRGPGVGYRPRHNAADRRRQSEDVRDGRGLDQLVLQRSQSWQATDGTLA
jgi:hypothetical protein